MERKHDYQTYCHAPKQILTLLGIFIYFLCAPTVTGADELHGPEIADAMHEHLTGAACVDVPADQKRPEFGCFNIAREDGLQFPQSEVYWHLRMFPNRTAAKADKSPTGIVVEEDGRVWLSEFGPRNLVLRGGNPIAVVGPLKLPPAKSYSAVLSYAVMRPGDRSRVHTHPGPEAWYMIAGEQCLETPTGVNRAQSGGTMTAPPNVPMELSITGKARLKSLALVIHDSFQMRVTPSQWKLAGICSR